MQRWAEVDSDDFFWVSVGPSSGSHTLSARRSRIVRIASAFHADECVDWLRLYRPGFQGNVRAAYLTAVLAAGYILFTVGDSMRGVMWEVGVSPWRGRPATNAWQRVLDGELLLPS